MVRTRRGSSHATPPGSPTARGVRRATAVLGVGLLGIAPVAGGAAWAQPSDPAGPPGPAGHDVAAAHAAVDAARLDVAGAQQRLDAIRAELTAAEAQVQTAATDYTQAQADLAAARDAVAAARHQAEKAAAAQQDARAAMAEAYRSGARTAGSVGPLSVVTGVDDLDDVVAADAAQRAVERKAGSAFTAGADARAAAEQADARWSAAQDALAQAKKRATATLERAEGAVTALEVRTAAAEDERDALYARLAQLRRTSVEVERRHEEARQAAAERSEERAARAAAVETVRDASSATGDDTDPGPGAEPLAGSDPGSSGSGTAIPPSSDSGTSGGSGGSGDVSDVAGTAEPERTQDPAPAPEPEPEPTRTRDPEPEPEPEPVVTVGRSTAAQGQAAVAWARSKIGIPYQWGGEGNPGFDCSGLTSQAWNAAGLWITRTSRSQYVDVAKVSYDAMRPGDLIFYANDTSNPSTIRHVAIYAGGGTMVEAPRPGIAVRETAVRWTDVMPYAGRP